MVVKSYIQHRILIDKNLGLYYLLKHQKPLGKQETQGVFVYTYNIKRLRNEFVAPSVDNLTIS
jgi:hypothetical protein